MKKKIPEDSMVVCYFTSSASPTERFLYVLAFYSHSGGWSQTCKQLFMCVTSCVQKQSFCSCCVFSFMAILIELHFLKLPAAYGLNEIHRARFSRLGIITWARIIAKVRADRRAEMTEFGLTHR